MRRHNCRRVRGWMRIRMTTVELRALAEHDVALIRRWPPYPPEFEELDYALRADGWLNEYRSKPDTWCFAAEQSGDVVAFTILSKIDKEAAEFRVALRADATGRGLGAAVTSKTLSEAFSKLGFLKIHLIVRENHARAIRLYLGLGFVEKEKTIKNINQKLVRFCVMELNKDAFVSR